MKYKIDNEIYNVEIIKKNNKNTYIRVKDDLTVLVTTNYIASKNYIIGLLDNNYDYLLKIIKNKKKQIEKKQDFYYLGQKYDIIIMPSIDNIEIVGKRIYVKNNDYLNKWYKNQISTIFNERLRYNYKLFNKNIILPKLKIRKMKTRWGVYNRKNHSITLNSNLIIYDIKYIDYVIIHELCHTIYFDHSNNFWSLVSNYIPDYKKIRKELKD